jgi:four helix bundle protein
MFDHEKLDVYQVSLDFVAWSYRLSKNFKGADRHARDQLLRASQSIPLNIAEGNGKRSAADRKRFFQIARGSALECAAILDVLFRCGVLAEESTQYGKRMLNRIVSMLTKLTNVGGEVREERADYEHRDAEHEHEHEHEHEEWIRARARARIRARARARARRMSYVAILHDQALLVLDKPASAALLCPFSHLS